MDSDQEVCDLLIAKRRKLGQDLKLREKYYANTIAKGRISVQQEEVMKRLAQRQPGGGTVEGVANLGALESLSIVFRPLKVLNISRFPGLKPSYLMETNHGPVRLRDVNDVLVCERFKSRVAEGTGLVLNIKRVKTRWDHLAQCVLDAAVRPGYGGGR